MRTYEAVFILDNKKVEDGGEAFSKDIEQRVRDLGGKVVKADSLGRKQFARPIGKIRAGLYWDFLIDLDPAQVDTLKEGYRLNSTVLRLQVFTYEPPPVPKKKKSAER